MRNVDEYYASVASMLAKAVQEKKFKSAVFTSSQAGEGVTTAILKVAKQLQSVYRLSTLIVEFRTDKPTLASLLKLDEQKSLQRIGRSEVTPSACVQKIDDLHIIPSASRDEPIETSVAALTKIVGELESQYDVLLVDAPPVLEEAGRLTLIATEIVPRVVLIVQAGRTRTEMLERVRADLSTRNVAILGAILNKQRRYIPDWIYRWFVK